MPDTLTDSPAEIRVFADSDGLCMALPRYTDTTLTTVRLDGVVCLGRTTSKACFWDNQSNRVGFDYASGDIIPIGFADPAINPAGLYQAGGGELFGGSGGICTDCHAGENPFIIHPEVVLENALPGTGARTFVANGLTMAEFTVPPLSLPLFARQRYDPIVPASWPQNGLSQADPFVPPKCLTCHTRGGAGRLPHISSELESYCPSVLAIAVRGRSPPERTVAPTMPARSGIPGTEADVPGSMANHPDVLALEGFCRTSPTSNAASRGDPHLTTINGIDYDFQGAGEFVALRNSSSGFELQTRQTPVPTSFSPGPNPYTGLASCASLNTAAAVRLGRHRISYQPLARRLDRPERMQVRIDGRLVEVPANGIDLGGGEGIAPAVAGGGIEVNAADGTRLIITPSFWATEGYWYLDVEILDSPAREGMMGHIAPSNWLPYAPGGTSLGGAPGSLAERHHLLNVLFAALWRVTPETSLFDYAPGTSTATYTDLAWPPIAGTCVFARVNPWPGGPPRQPVEAMLRAPAARFCNLVEEDASAYRNCIFDLTATGNAGFAASYRMTLALRRHASR